MLEKVVPWDLLVAFGLIALGLVAVLLYRMGFLPKKSLPFVAAAIAGIVGWRIFKGRREAALRAEIKRIEGAIAERARELDALAVRAGTADEEVLAARAALEKQKAAVAKELLLLEERSAERRREIEAMGTNQVFEELRRL
jgi:hypothetical protein